MKLHELPKTTSSRKRVGRSISAGGGKTAGRGTKGQKSRTGKKLRYSFEGGQMPITQRLPKQRGFKRVTPKPIALSVDQLVKAKLTSVSPATLAAAGLIQNEKVPVKIIAGKAEADQFTFSDVRLSSSIAPKPQRAAEKKDSEPEAEGA